MINKITNLNIILGFVLLGLSSVVEAKTYVVASQKFPSSQLDISTVKEAFMGRAVSISAGNNVIAVDRFENDAKVRAQFIKKVLGWNTTRYKAFWSQIIFTGKGDALPLANSVDQINALLEKNNNAISFVDESEKTNQMKVLLTLE